MLDWTNRPGCHGDAFLFRRCQDSCRLWSDHASTALCWVHTTRIKLTKEWTTRLAKADPKPFRQRKHVFPSWIWRPTLSIARRIQGWNHHRSKKAVLFGAYWCESSKPGRYKANTQGWIALANAITRGFCCHKVYKQVDPDYNGSLVCDSFYSAIRDQGVHEQALVLVRHDADLHKLHLFQHWHALKRAHGAVDLQWYHQSWICVWV